MDGRWSKLMVACTLVATCMIAPRAFAEDSEKAKDAPAPAAEEVGKENAEQPAAAAKTENVHVALHDVTIRKKWDDVVGKLDNMEKQWTAQGRRVIPVVDMKQDPAEQGKADRKKIDNEREARKLAEQEEKQKQKAREEVEALKRDTQKKQ